MLTLRQDQFAGLVSGVRRNLAYETIRAMRRTSPHAVLGLAEAEIGERLEGALSTAEAYGFDSIRDLRSFIQLCFRVGPRFAEYGPIQALMQSGSVDPLAFAMEEARDDDWIGAAVFDIVVRYADSVAAPDGVAPADRGVFADGISLAPLNRSHSTGYYRLALHPDVWRLADASPLLTPTDAEERIVEIEADRNQLASAILHDQAGFIGAVSTDTSSEPAMLSYWIGRPFWNRGAASRAVALHLAYLAALGIQRVQASVFCGNEPSIRVLRRCSFVPLAGTLRQDGAVTRFGAKLAPTR